MISQHASNVNRQKSGQTVRYLSTCKGHKSLRFDAFWYSKDAVLERTRSCDRDTIRVAIPIGIISRSYASPSSAWLYQITSRFGSLILRYWSRLRLLASRIAASPSTLLPETRTSATRVITSYLFLIESLFIDVQVTLVMNTHHFAIHRENVLRV